MQTVTSVVKVARLKKSEVKLDPRPRLLGGHQNLNFRFSHRISKGFLFPLSTEVSRAEESPAQVSRNII